MKHSSNSGPRHTVLKEMHRPEAHRVEPAATPKPTSPRWSESPTGAAATPRSAGRDDDRDSVINGHGHGPRLHADWDEP